MDKLKPYTSISIDELVKKDFNNNRNFIQLQSIEELKGKALILKEPKGSLFYFDHNGIYQTSKIKNRYICNRMPKTIACELENGTNITYITAWNQYSKQPAIPKVIDNVIIQMKWVIAVLSTLAPNENTIEDFIVRYNLIVELNTSNQNKNLSLHEAFYKKYPKQNTVDSVTDRTLKEADVDKQVFQFIYRIDKPTFERTPENPNTKTFDFIRIRLSIPTKDTKPDRIEFIKQHKNDIANIALLRIAKAKQFIKYGIPINFLKLEYWTVTMQSELELVFGLKDI